MVEFNKENFDEIMNNNQIVMVDFFANWCGPCKALLPVMDELSNDNKNMNVTIGKLNVDENQDLAVKFGVRGIPTTIIFKNGVEVDGGRMVGVRPKQDYQNVIDGLL